MVVASFVWPKTIAIAGIVYSVADTHRVSKGKKWHNKCYEFHKKYKDSKNPPNPYLIEYMKRKKGDADHKIPDGKWTMYDLKVQKKKPAGFKKAKKEKK